MMSDAQICAQHFRSGSWLYSCGNRVTCIAWITVSTEYNWTSTQKKQNYDIKSLNNEMKVIRLSTFFFFSFQFLLYLIIIHDFLLIVTHNYDVLSHYYNFLILTLSVFFYLSLYFNLSSFWLSHNYDFACHNCLMS